MLTWDSESSGIVYKWGEEMDKDNKTLSLVFKIFYVTFFLCLAISFFGRIYDEHMGEKLCMPGRLEAVHANPFMVICSNRHDKVWIVHE